MGAYQNYQGGIEGAVVDGDYFKSHFIAIGVDFALGGRKIGNAFIKEFTPVVNGEKKISGRIYATIPRFDLENPPLNSAEFEIR